MKKNLYLLLFLLAPFSSAFSQGTFWSEDFGGGLPPNWQVTANQGTSDLWAYTTTGAAGAFAIADILSTTAGNGWMIFDSDLLCSGDQDAWLISEPIDCSLSNIVELRFQQQYRSYFDETFVEVSTDGINWTEVAINDTIQENAFCNGNPETIHINISAVAGLQPQVWIAWRFLSTGGGNFGCAYSWHIDDVVLSDVLTSMDTISGYVYYDLNQDGVFDPNDAPAHDIVVNLENRNVFANTDSSGFYSFIYPDYLVYPNDTLRAIFPLVYASINPPNIVMDNINGQVSNQNFGIIIPNQIQDLSILIAANTPPRPGFNEYIDVRAANYCNAAQNSIVKFLPDPNMPLLSSMPPPDGMLADTLYWQIIIAPHEVELFHFVFNTPVNIALGTNVHWEASITAPIDDFNPIDNHFTLDQTVVGAYDPNDKTVSPVTYTTENLSRGDSLYYFIRFQNTGNYYAENVRILDTLDADLDPATFRFVASSHPCHWSLHGEGIVEFFFDNIMLLDSNANEPASHGFVSYSIEPRPNLNIGDQITNTAYIFFDFNAPIATNTAQNQIESPVFVPQIVTLSLPLHVWPNPAYDLLFVEVPQEYQVGEIALYDVLGKLVLRGPASQPQLSVKSLPSGVYQCVLRNADGDVRVAKVLLER